MNINVNYVVEYLKKHGLMKKRKMKELWGELKEEERVVICDDCFKMVYPSKNLELARKCGYKK